MSGTRLLYVVLSLCVLLGTAGHAWSFAPVGPGEKVLLEQTTNVGTNGGASHLYTPQAARVMLDLSVEPGKSVLVIVLTDEQFKAASVGEKPSGNPVMRETTSGDNTLVFDVDRGSYVVTLFSTSGTANVSLRARARAR